MTRSRRRKLLREQTRTQRATPLRTIMRAGVPLAALVAGLSAAQAQTAGGGGLQTIVITAQKIRQNLQNVPISVEVFNNKEMRQLNIANIDDYVKMAPTVTFVRSQGEGDNGGPGGAIIYIRDVVSGGDGNHSGSEPSVGVYLDQQPVTTITGVVPEHMYDINRIEVLEGPQGTLFGSSAEAGAVRIITNKPDPTRFSAGYDLQENIIQDGGPGHVIQGFVNIPLWANAAVRLVGWDVHHGGFISNVAGTDANGCIFNGVRTFPTWSLQASGIGPGGNTGQCAIGSPIGAGAITVGPWLKNNYNTSDTYGGRVELRFTVNDPWGDPWTVTPTFQGQSISADGFFGYDPAVGYLKLTHFGPETSHDTWDQTALTIEGKIHDFDVVYTGGYLKRNQHSIADYSDYSEFYDKMASTGAYYVGNSGAAIMPQQFVIGAGDFEMWSQELRVTTPLDEPVHATVGAYLGRQMHNIWQLYTMPGFGWTNVYGGGIAAGNPNGLGYLGGPNNPNNLSIPGFPNAIWLTDEQRIDRDRAVYAQATWDITHQWHLTGGMRFYHYDNSLVGFYGFNKNFFAGEGTATCFEGPIVKYSPCTDLDAQTTGSGHVPRVNLTYQITPNKMVYATYSKGYRPGGVNRIAPPSVVQGVRPAPVPYQADFLTNYEIGWKTQWFHNTVRWNGALFWEEWKDFQFSHLGANSVTIIANAGNARIQGVESDVEWVPVHNLFLSTNFSFTDPVLTQTFYTCPQGTAKCAHSPVPAGTNLPVAPKFKGNVIVRYTLPMMGDWKPYVQLAGMYQDETSSALLLDQNAVYGNLPAYALFNFKLGANAGNGMHVDLFISNLMNRLAQYSRFTESNPSLDSQVYILPAQPRTFGVEFGQDF